MISEKTYTIWKPRFGILAAGMLLVISIYFSQYGFSFKDTTEWGVGIGLALSIAITIIQLAGGLEENGKDYLLWVVWVVSYVYGITSNVKGLLDFMGNREYFTWAIAISVGVMIEIAPERLFKLALMNSRKAFIRPDKQEETKGQPKQITPSKPSFPQKQSPTYMKPTEKQTPSVVPSWKRNMQNVDELL